MSNLQLARLLFVSPSQMFAALKEQPVFALPMWLLLLGTMLSTGWYYGIVDVAWLQEQTLLAAKVPPDQAAAMAARITRPVLLWSSVIIAPVAVVAIVAIISLYFMLAGAITNVRYSFKHWFALNWWSSTPGIVGVIPTLLILALSDTTQIPPSALQPLSFNELFFHLPTGAPGSSFMQAFGILQFVGAWLNVVGVKAFSGRSWLFSSVVGLLPTVLIYGVWALVSFR